MHLLKRGDNTNGYVQGLGQLCYNYINYKICHNSSGGGLQVHICKRLKSHNSARVPVLNIEDLNAADLLRSLKISSELFEIMQKRSS